MSIILLDQSNIKKNIPENITLEIFETLPSTHLYLLNYLNSAFHHILNNKEMRICLSEHQSAGVGRYRCRNWHSPYGENIYFSCLYAFKKNVSELQGLSLMVGLAVIDVLNHFQLRDKVYIKWPNDIVTLHGKLGGVLIEAKFQNIDIKYPHKVVISVGLNINMKNEKKNSQHISQKFVSLSELNGGYVNRNQFCILLIQRLYKIFQDLETMDNSLEKMMRQWNAVDYLANQNIILKTHRGHIKGRAIGINTSGHLLLELENKQVQAFSAGEVSVNQILL